jgi:hypothetical protein
LAGRSMRRRSGSGPAAADVVQKFIATIPFRLNEMVFLPIEFHVRHARFCCNIIF